MEPRYCRHWLSGWLQVKKKTGKRLMTRHMQDTRKKRDEVEEGTNEEEDIKEFFM